MFCSCGRVPLGVHHLGRGPLHVLGLLAGVLLLAEHDVIAWEYLDKSLNLGHIFTLFLSTLNPLLLDSLFHAWFTLLHAGYYSDLLTPAAAVLPHLSNRKGRSVEGKEEEG